MLKSSGMLRSCIGSIILDVSKDIFTLILRVKQSCVVCLTLTLEAKWPANRRELFTIYAVKHPTWLEL